MSEEENMARYTVYFLDGDPETPVINSAPNHVDLGTMLIGVVGVGQPYWTFQSLPPEILGADAIGAKLDGAPICSDDPQTNRNNVAGLFASPPAVGMPDNSAVWAVE